MSRRRIVISIGVLLILPFVSVACGSHKPAPKPPEPLAAEGKEEAPKPEPAEPFPPGSDPNSEEFKKAKAEDYMKGLSDPDANVRAVAAELLGDIGPEAKIAVPALTQALDDPDPDVRRYASVTLGRITRDILLKEIRDAEKIVSGVNGESSDAAWGKLEKAFKALLEKHESPEEKAVICENLARDFAQRGFTKPSKTIEYAKRALEGLTDPVARLDMYGYWAEAIEDAHAGARDKEFSDARKEAVVPFLLGLKETVTRKLPDKAPQFQGPGVVNEMLFAESKKEMQDLVRKKRIEQEERGKVIAEIRLQEQMIQRRDWLTAGVINLYTTLPLATEELRAVATDVVGDPATADKLVRLTEARIKEQADKGFKERYGDSRP